MEELNNGIQITEKKHHKKLFNILKATSVFIFSIGILLLYSHFLATKGIIVKEYKVNAPTISDNFDGIKIVHISDIHYGTTIYKKELDTLVNKINETKPDIVIFTGDLINTDAKLNQDRTNEIINSLSKIEATLGKYAIKGDHDYNFTEFDEIITKSGFINLLDTYELIYNETNLPIMIVGLNSNLKSDNLIKDKISSINESINEINYSYKILILHEPDYIDDIDYSSYNLILSGHSLGGQIKLPFIDRLITPTKAKKYYGEYYKLNNTDLFVSSGIGTSNISFRLFNKPSFNLYRISK